MDTTALQSAIESAWDDRENLSPTTTGEVREAVQDALNALDNGEIRVAEKKDEGWHVNQWAKKAVLLSFRLN